MADTPLKAQKIGRDELAKFLPTPRLIKAFENVVSDVAEGLPESVGGAKDTADQALALATLQKNRFYVVSQTQTDLPNSRVLDGARGIEVVDQVTPGRITVRAVDFLAALHLLAVDGFVARSGTNAQARTLTPASPRIVITDGNGVGANPTFDVSETALQLQNIGGTLPISKGGTGATTATAARAALGIDAAFLTGDFKQRSGLTFPAGWVRANAGTIGNTGSGATRANADTQDLFTLWWTSYSNTDVPIQTNTGAASTRGASASADFTANKRMTVPVVADVAPLIGGYKL